MANEAVLVFRTEDPVDFIVSNTVGIEKGATLKMADPMTASQATGAADLVAGICAREKIASDGRTECPVFMGGIFRMKISGSAAIGDPVVTDTFLNHVKSARGLTAFDLSGTRILGYMLETATTGQNKLVRLRPTPMNGV